MNRTTRLALLELEPRFNRTFLGNPVFPLDNPWNQVIANAPVSANSTAILDAIAARHGGAVGLHPDFGNPARDGALYGIPINVVDATVAAVNVSIAAQGYADESDLVPVPIPADAVIEGDGPTGPSDPNFPSRRGDSHLLVYDRVNNVLYELVSAARPNEASYPYGGSKPLGVWGAWQISVWDLKTNTFRTLRKTSADAAGLPIMPGLVRPDEILNASPVIDHAIRMTVQRTRSEYVYPASHEASSDYSSNLPRMGERFRLRSDFPIPQNWTAETKAIAQAMKTYGMIVADNGSDMYFQGTPSTDWNMSAILQLGQIKSSDFEVVDLTPVITSLSVNTGSTAGGDTITIAGKNFSGAAGQLHVLFGTTEASSVTILSDSQLRVTTPARAAGTVDVRVQSGRVVNNLDNQPEFFGYGTSAPSAATPFTFATGGTSPPPSPPPPGFVPDPIVVGGRTNGTAAIYTADANGMYALAYTVQPFGAVTANLRTAVGDVNGDGTPDYILATGPGTTFRVTVLSGVDRSTLVAPFAPFDDFSAGGFVSAADFRRSGRVQFVVTPDRAGGPRVSIFELVPGSGLVRQANYFSLDPNFRGGLRTAAGDVNGDGTPDLALAAGFGGGPRISILNGTHVLTTDGFTESHKLVPDFFAFEPGLRNGTYVAIGDLDGDGRGDLVFGAGPGGSPRVLAVSGDRLLTQGHDAALNQPLANFIVANEESDRGGVRVAIVNADGDARRDLLTGAGENRPARARLSLGSQLASIRQQIDPFANDVLADGLFVG
ncbi:MAG: IPT/TIG domain-containing protein [Gemmataceae bacterium]